MKVEIFGTPTCGYCTQSVQMCESNGISYTYCDLIKDPTMKDTLEKRIGNVIKTVPQIFVDGDYLQGGYTALRDKLSNSG